MSRTVRVLLICLVVLAGCADVEPVPPVPDASVALHDLAGEAVHQFGPQTDGTPDAHIVVGHCGATRNVMAYHLNATQLGITGDLDLAARSVPNTTAFLIAAFVPGPQGLELATAWQGGTEANLDPYDAQALPQWSTSMPKTLAVPAGSDGAFRFVVACSGGGAVNFVVEPRATHDPRAPDYLDAVQATGFDRFIALGRDDLGTIYLPPTGPPSPPAAFWSTAGEVRTSFTQDIAYGVRAGTTTIHWSAPGPGWATAMCSHYGLSEHGRWRYEGTLHGAARQDEGLLVDDLATLGLVQFALEGEVRVVHTSEGNASASLSFEVEHTASSPIGWTTTCQGFHLGAPLQTLLGAPAAQVWLPPTPWL